MEANRGTTGTRRVGEIYYCESLHSLVPRRHGMRLGFIELPKAVNVPLVSANHSLCTLSLWLQHL